MQGKSISYLTYFDFNRACIYDKSLGPDAGPLAESNMEGLAAMMKMAAEENSKATKPSTAASILNNNNMPAILPRPLPSLNASSGNETAPFDLSQCTILEPAVTKTPDESMIVINCTMSTIIIIYFSMRVV